MLSATPTPGPRRRLELKRYHFVEAGPGPPGHGEGNATAAGNLLCLLSALLYALYTNMMKKLLPQGRGGRGA